VAANAQTRAEVAPVRVLRSSGSYAAAAGAQAARLGHPRFAAAQKGITGMEKAQCADRDCQDCNYAQYIFQAFGPSV
jgi:hypothetical protein